MCTSISTYLTNKQTAPHPVGARCADRQAQTREKTLPHTEAWVLLWLRAVLVASLQAQLLSSQVNQKLVSFAHFNAEQSVDSTRVIALEWLPQSKGENFVAAHSSGNVYVYQKVRSSVIKYTFSLHAEKLCTPTWGFMQISHRPAGHDRSRHTFAGCNVAGVAVTSLHAEHYSADGSFHAAGTPEHPQQREELCRAHAQRRGQRRQRPRRRQRRARPAAEPGHLRQGPQRDGPVARRPEGGDCGQGRRRARARPRQRHAAHRLAGEAYLFYACTSAVPVRSSDTPCMTVRRQWTRAS